MAEQERGLGIPRRREFILAMSIFVALAVVGTIFALWYVSRLTAAHSQPVVVTTPPR